MVVKIPKANLFHFHATDNFVNHWILFFLYITFLHDIWDLCMELCWRGISAGKDNPTVKTIAEGLQRSPLLSEGRLLLILRK